MDVMILKFSLILDENQRPRPRRSVISIEEYVLARFDNFAGNQIKYSIAS